MQIVFAANVLVAGIVGFLGLFYPELAARTVFQSPNAPGVGTSVTGAFWLAIALLSLPGVFFPLQLSAILLVQLLYKGLWLAVIAVPALLNGSGAQLPVGMAVFFAVWVVVIPVVYPWGLLFRSSPALS